MADLPRQGSPVSTLPLIAQAGVPDNLPGHSQVYADNTGALQVKLPNGSTSAIGGGGGGSGTVTSVTLTGDGTVLSSTPSAAVTTSGTLAAALASQNGNGVLVAPAAGGSGVPTFRKLNGENINTYTLGGTAIQTVSNKTTSYTAVQTDAGTLFTDRGSSSQVTITLPSNPTVGTTLGFMTFFPSSSARLRALCSGSDTIMYSGTAATFTSATSSAGGRAAGGNFIFLTYMGTNVWAPTGGFYFDWTYA